MPVPPELATACADTAEAGPADAIGGRQARYVAAPASTDESSALLRAAAGLGLTVVPRGAGLLQHWGNPPDSCDLIVDTHRLDRIVEHVPGDFTVTVQAGVRVPGLEKMLEAGGQTLRLTPPRRAWTSTVGGAVATNAAGIHRFRYGTPRDQLIGITAVRADGTVVRSADVAGGVDLARLFAGSYGTLGLITEATFRVHRCPRGVAGVGVDCANPDDAARIIEIIAADLWVAAAGISLYWASPDRPIKVLVRVENDSADFQQRVDRVHVLAGRAPVPPPDPSTARHLDAPDHGGLPPAVAQRLLAERERHRAELLNPPADSGTLVRASFPPRQLAPALTAIQATAADGGLTVAIERSCGLGVLDVKVPAETRASEVSRFVETLRTELGQLAGAVSAPGAASALVVYAPDHIRAVTDMLGPARPASRSQAAKEQFDPQHRMAPGRVAEAA
jgi:glycolate oxidase FAD binding subunit